MKNTDSQSNKKNLNKPKKNEGPVKYNDEDPKDPTGSEEDISTPKNNSGYDEKQSD